MRARTTWRWTWGGGSEAGSISLTVDLFDTERRHAQLGYSINGEPKHERVEIIGRPMRYGGFRFYFRCPVCSRLCELVYAASGRFVCRQCAKLAYASQSETILDRTLRAKLKLEGRLWPGGKRPKPRGRRAAEMLRRWSMLEERSEEMMNERICHMYDKIRRYDQRR